MLGISLYNSGDTERFSPKTNVQRFCNKNRSSVNVEDCDKNIILNLNKISYHVDSDQHVTITYHVIGSRL